MLRNTRRARLVGVLAIAPLILVLAAGCSSDGTSDAGADPSPSASTPSSSAPTATPSSSAPAVAGEYASYVALGDSYTAAPLVPTTDTTNGCLRSDHNYPSLVAAALPGTALDDVSCSGADSTSMVGVQQTLQQVAEPQFDALTKDTDLVTVGIGGNDFGLFSTLTAVCVQARASDPTGTPCEDQLTANGTDQLADDLTKIRDRVSAIVKGIRDRSPDARILVVGYPQIIPASGSCPKLLPIAAGDYPYARTINEGLAASVQQGTKRAGVGAQYVDIFKASAGHDICASDPWINGITTDPAAALAFHPFAAEQEAVAGLITARLAG